MELHALLGTIYRDVGPRTGLNRRTQFQKEIWCLTYYLLTLDREQRLPYPIWIEKSERPDFIGCLNSTRFGLEVTEATDPTDQREMTLMESKVQTLTLGALGGRCKNGLKGLNPERQICKDIGAAISRKAKKIRAGKYQNLTEMRLLIYVNSNPVMLLWDESDLHPFLNEAFVRSWRSACDEAGIAEIAILVSNRLFVSDKESFISLGQPEGLDGKMNIAVR